METLTDSPEVPSLGDLYNYAIKQDLYTKGDGNTAGRRSTWPKGTSTEKTVLACLGSIVHQHSAEMARALPHGGSIFGYSTSASLLLVDGDSAYEPTVFNIVEKRLSWKTARLAGGSKQSTAYSDRGSTVSRLASSREIFSSQQTRMWAYGITLCAHEFRIWLFDRVGGLGTRLIIAHKEPFIFIKAINGFARMDSGHLGLIPPSVGGHRLKSQMQSMMRPSFIASCWGRD